jgi:hypothetical protein
MKIPSSYSTYFILATLTLLTACGSGGGKKNPPIITQSSAKASLVAVSSLSPSSNATSSVVSTSSADGKTDLTVIAVNVGGKAYTTTSGIRFGADAYAVGGTLYKTPTVAIANTDDDDLYLSERYGTQSYDIDAANGSYDVSLMYAETFHKAANLRLFDVEIEGTKVETSLDLFAIAGANTAYITKKSNVAVADGKLSLKLTTVKEQAKLSAILVTQRVPLDGDVDADGVTNANDKCYATPPSDAGKVDSKGCGPSQLDADNDGVADTKDTCPGTLITDAVDANGCSNAQKDTDGDGIKDNADRCDHTPTGETIDVRGCGLTTEQGVRNGPFIEKDGLVVVEMESTSYPAPWTLVSGGGSYGDGYLVWEGLDYFTTPGTGVISIRVRITNPGTYRFNWRNLITFGTVPGDYNDTWLKILANKFYALKDTDLTDTRCPTGKPASNSCVGPAPAGATSAGWFKVYRSGTPVTDWFWQAYTYDEILYRVYADFSEAGDYEIQISGRSAKHGIDRVVMYKENNAMGNVTEAFATSSERGESLRAADTIGRFNITKDLLLANFDTKPDVDDIHSQAGLGTMLKDKRFKDVKFHATMGAFGTQAGAFIDSTDLFNLAFGTNWKSAVADYNVAVDVAATKAIATLNAGGDVWIQEAGQSDFSADVVRKIKTDLPAVNTVSKIHLVQHSTWNESVTTPADLTYVQANTDYIKIADGNAAGNGTPGFSSAVGTDWARAVADPEVGALWTEARRLANEKNVPGIFFVNENIKAGGFDFSDVSEDCWVFGFETLPGVPDFFDEFL